MIGLFVGFARPCSHHLRHEIKCRLPAADVLTLVSMRRLDARYARAARDRRAPVRDPGDARGTTYFLMNTLPKVGTKLALCVLIYNLSRVLDIVGVPAVLDAIKG